jgi:hypothetical protein
MTNSIIWSTYLEADSRSANQQIIDLLLNPKDDYCVQKPLEIIIIIIIISVEPFVEPWQLFSFLILYTVSRTPWTGDQPVAKASTYTRNNTNRE